MTAIDVCDLSIDAVRADHPIVFQHLSDNVLPERAENSRKPVRERWWIYGDALHASNYRRLQRFFQFVQLDGDVAAQLVVRMLKLGRPKLLALDRTNWKLGSRDVNVLVLAVVTRRFRVPLMAERLLVRLRTVDQEAFEKVSKEVAEKGTALNWLVGNFFRDQMWDHGRVGDRPSQPGQWVFTDDFLDVLLEIMRTRLSSTEVQEKIAEMPDVSTFLFGWRDISGEAEAQEWVASNSSTDEGFLAILNHLRSWAMSDRVYYPLHKSSIEAFFDLENAVARLAALRESAHGDLVRELEEAMEQARH